MMKMPERVVSMKLLPIIVFGIVIVSLTSFLESQAESPIPEWVKELTKSWSEDKISNEDFANAVNYLVKNDIIMLPEMESLLIENQHLKQEMREMEEKLTNYERETNLEKLTITVHTNKNLYGSEDDIIVFGTISSIVKDHEVGIVISNANGKILAIAKIPPNEDKSYGFVAKSSIFKQSGDYSVHVYYGGQAFDHTEYSYRPITQNN